MSSRRDGFTLVEVVVASTIAAFVAVVAVGTLRAISRSGEMIDENIRVAAELRYAGRMIAGDLVNLYRDKDVANMKLVGASRESEGGITSYLAMYTVGRVKARSAEPEGDVYEVEYYLETGGEKPVLLRRLWPYPDREVEPGGVLTVIAEDIGVFEVRFFDGQEWQTEWPEEVRSVPILVEVNIAAQMRGRSQPLVSTFVTNFARSVWESSGTSGEQGSTTGERGSTTGERSNTTEERSSGTERR